MGKIPILVLSLTIFLVGIVSAVQTCELYDDFSSGGLDLSKWEEVENTLDEHFVNSSEEAYHTAQIIPSDKVVFLKFKDRVFFSGDIIEYDVNYISGSGNRQSRIQIDNLRYSIFGFWNTVEDAGVGNDFGVYHVKVNFSEEGLSNEITLPNGTIRHTRPDGVLPSPGLNHTFGVVTRTGHNGVVHMDYDNFITCTEEPSENNIEERVATLEARVDELESRTSVLENIINGIVSFLNNELPKGISFNF